MNVAGEDGLVGNHATGYKLNIWDRKVIERNNTERITFAKGDQVMYLGSTEFDFRYNFYLIHFLFTYI